MPAAGDFHVKPEQIQGAGPAMTMASAAVSAAVGRLRSTLDGLGAFWGDDEQGAKLAAGYEPRAGTVTTAVTNIGTGLTTIAEGLDAHGQNHTTTDTSTATRFSP